MSRRLFLVAFDNDADVLAAVRASRKQRFRVADVYAPYPVHGLSEAMGLPPSRLPRVCLVAGAAGAALMAYFQFWTTAIAWPLDIGGKPWNSLPAFMPPIFESMVLLAALSSVAAFFVLRGLVPGKEPSPSIPGATDTLFVVAVEENDVLRDATAVGRAFEAFHVRRVETRQAEDA